MRYLCTNCSYIYDEGEWDEVIKQWTRFEKLDYSFVCPVCWEEKDGFQEIIEEINYVSEDPYDHLEIDHYLEIDKIWDILKVIIGNEIHPMGESHRITSVSLYDEYGELIEEIFLKFDEDPTVEFQFDDLWEFEIRCRCSLHGVWGRKFRQ